MPINKILAICELLTISRYKKIGRIEAVVSLVDEIRRFGGEATSITADVSEFEQVRAIADKAVQTYGRLDTWVHCAAINLYATFEQTTPEEFKRIVDVNLIGQVHGAMAALYPISNAKEGER